MIGIGTVLARAIIRRKPMHCNGGTVLQCRLGLKGATTLPSKSIDRKEGVCVQVKGM